MKRLVRALREEGAAGLVSKRRGHASNRRIDEDEKAEKAHHSDWYASAPYG